MKEYDKIPIEKVIEDMSNPDGGIVLSAARDYYETHYVDKNDTNNSDQNEKEGDYILFGIIMVYLIFMIYTTIKLIF